MLASAYQNKSSEKSSVEKKRDKSQIHLDCKDTSITLDLLYIYNLFKHVD